MNHFLFFPVYYFWNSFLYISYVELVDTEGKEASQEFLTAKSLSIRQRQILYFVCTSEWEV